MLFDISYTDPEIEEAIETLVGKPLPWWRRLSKRLFGSQRFEIIDGCDEIKTKLSETNNTIFGNLAILPKGVKIWMTVKLHIYLLALPFSDLKLQIKNNQLHLSNQQYWILLKPAHGSSLNLNFVNKVHHAINSFSQE